MVNSTENTPPLVKERNDGEYLGETKTSILDDLVEGCQILGLDWKYLYINKAAEKQNRRPVSELLGRKYTDVWPGIEKTKVYRAIKQCIENKGHKNFENKFVFLDNSVGWFDIRVQPIPEGVFIMSIDITDRKLYERALQERDEKFESVFESANVAKSIITPSGNFQINKAFCDLLGYSLSEFSNKRWQEVIPEEDVEVSEKEIKTLLTGGVGAVRCERRFMHKDGRNVWVDLSMVIHKNEQNIPQFLIATAIDITEQKRITEELEYNNSLLAEMGRVAKIVGWEYNINNGKGFLTNEAINIYESDSHDNSDLGRGFYTEKSISKIEKAVRRSVKEKNEFSVELEMVTAKGNHKWVRTVGRPVIKNDKVEKLRGYLQDITKEKKVLVELEESHQRFATVFKYSPLPASLMKVYDLTYIEVNEAWCKVVGMTRKEIIGSTPLQLGIMDKVEVGLMKNILKKQVDVIKRESHIYNSQGYKRTILTSMVPLYEKNEKLNLNMFIDITERKNMIEKISEDERMMKTLLGNLPGMAYRCKNNMNWDMEFLSEGCSALTGYHPAEILNNKISYSNIIHPEDRADIWNKIQLAVHNKSSFELEYRVITKNKTVKWVWEKGKLVSTENEGVLEGFISDITARKFAEQKITILNDDLEKKVEQRTKQLAAMNKELQTFTYSVSHDLKAPLRGIDGYSKLLQENFSEKLGEEEESSLFVKYIRDGTKQMNLLIEDLLTYSRLERNKCIDKKINFQEIIEGILINYKQEIIERHIAVHTNILDTVIITDYNSLSMALRNIIDNAFKFTKENDSPTISISVEEVGENYLIEVTDNGIGFDMQYHDKIFNIFQRLQRIEDYPGTGIGLALVIKAVHRIGGQVWAKSEPGIKTTFSIELPKTKKNGINKP